MSANDRQVGGSHYKQADGGEEHWDRVARLKLNYFQARATAYIERAPQKNGKADIEKGIHFLEKYLEVWDILHPTVLIPYCQVVEPTQDEIKNSVGWLEETKARENYEVEGFSAGGEELFKCKYCRQEGWGLLASRNLVNHLDGCPHGPRGPAPASVPTPLDGPF